MIRMIRIFYIFQELLKYYVIKLPTDSNTLGNNVKIIIFSLNLQINNSCNAISVSFLL